MGKKERRQNDKEQARRNGKERTNDEEQERRNGERKNEDRTTKNKKETRTDIAQFAIKK